MKKQTYHVYFALKQRGHGYLQDVSTWNTSGVFVGRPGTLLKRDSNTVVFL